MAVIGFDDIELASEIAPPLTTVRIPLLEIGKRAADLLLDAVQAEHDDNRARSEILPVELVVRGSA
jgi:LacI family transcriptional regulator